ncbi:DUF7210 family protein [Orbus mooreae]|uniref:DUF7210 family protein n=1 Tax=Orbus mooreae TaxID=3074107 RepID=UPI00370D90EC
MVKIHLLATVIHDGKTLEKGHQIEITAPQAHRLVNLGVAEIIESSQVDNPTDISNWTKKQCEAELTSLGISFDPKLKVADLRDLILKAREGDDEHTDVSLMSREELEQKLTELAVPFSGDSSDDVLRQLLLDELDEDNE